VNSLLFYQEYCKSPKYSEKGEILIREPITKLASMIYDELCENNSSALISYIGDKIYKWEKSGSANDLKGMYDFQNILKVMLSFLNQLNKTPSLTVAYIPQCVSLCFGDKSIRDKMFKNSLPDVAATYFKSSIEEIKALIDIVGQRKPQPNKRKQKGFPNSEEKRKEYNESLNPKKYEINVSKRIDSGKKLLRHIEDMQYDLQKGLSVLDENNAMLLKDLLEDNLNKIRDSKQEIQHFYSQETKQYVASLYWVVKEISGHYSNNKESFVFGKFASSIDNLIKKIKQSLNVLEINEMHYNNYTDFNKTITENTQCINKLLSGLNRFMLDRINANTKNNVNVKLDINKIRNLFYENLEEIKHIRENIRYFNSLNAIKQLILILNLVSDMSIYQDKRSDQTGIFKDLDTSIAYIKERVKQLIRMLGAEIIDDNNDARLDFVLNDTIINSIYYRENIDD
jgi:hypothetical protein